MTKVEGISQQKFVEKNEFHRSEVINMSLQNCSEEKNGKFLRRNRAETGVWKVFHRKDYKHNQLTFSVNSISAERLLEICLNVN